MTSPRGVCGLAWMLELSCLLRVSRLVIFFRAQSELNQVASIAESKSAAISKSRGGKFSLGADRPVVRPTPRTEFVILVLLMSLLSDATIVTASGDAATLIEARGSAVVLAAAAIAFLIGCSDAASSRFGKPSACKTMTFSA